MSNNPDMLAQRLSGLTFDERFPQTILQQSPPMQGSMQMTSPPLLPSQPRYTPYASNDIDNFQYYSPASLPMTSRRFDPPFSPISQVAYNGNTDIATARQNEFEYGQSYGVDMGPNGGNGNVGLGIQGIQLQSPNQIINQGTVNNGSRNGAPQRWNRPGNEGGNTRQMRENGTGVDKGQRRNQQQGGDNRNYWPMQGGVLMGQKKDQNEAHSPRPANYHFNSVPRSVYGQYTPDTPTYGTPLQYGMHPMQPNYGLQTPYTPMANRRYRRYDDNPRSALLEDFRLNKADRHWDLNEIYGHLVEFSGDQHGSRLIQNKLETASVSDKQSIYDEIIPHVYTLMTDVFGNYVIQKFFEFGSESQIKGLANGMKGHVLTLSMQMYGCRVVQKALDVVQEDEKNAIIKELDGHLIECVKSANANHVVQRLVMKDPPKFVPDAFLGHVEELSVHSFGCRVLQKAVEHLPQAHKRDLLEEMHKCAPKLIEDAFGNYVIQSIITTGEDVDRDKVINIMKGQVWSLSKHKFASNVVEKAIKHANPDDRRELVYELVNMREDGSNRVLAILRDPFANFVFQTCLFHAERSQRQQLLDVILPIMPHQRHTPVGKRLEQKINEMEQEGFATSIPAKFPDDHLTLPPNQPTTNASSLAQSTKTDSGDTTLASSDSTGLTAFDMCRSNSSSTRITSPSSLHNMNPLRPTSSAPPGTVFGKDQERGKEVDLINLLH